MKTKILADFQICISVPLIFSGRKLRDYFIYWKRAKSSSSGSHCLTHLSLHEECAYSELFWSVILRIWIEYGEIVRISFRIQSE